MYHGRMRAQREISVGLASLIGAMFGEDGIGAAGLAEFVRCGSFDAGTHSGNVMPYDPAALKAAAKAAGHTVEE